MWSLAPGSAELLLRRLSEALKVRMEAFPGAPEVGISMIRAYAYLRVSGKSQTDGDGFPRQRGAISAFAAAAGIEIVQEFVERAVPGKTEWEDRPAFGAMMTAILSDGVSTIIIESLNRLARDLMVQEHIIADLRRNGITLISAAEPDLCTDDPSRKLLRQIMGAIAEYDRACIVAKLRAARVRKRAAGDWREGRKPFGARAGEAETLALMRRYRVEGRKFAEIAWELEAAGAQTR